MSGEVIDLVASDGVPLRVERHDADGAVRATVLFAAPTGIEAAAYVALHGLLNRAGLTVYFCEARYAVRAADSADVPDLSLHRHGLDLVEIWQQEVQTPVILLGHCVGALAAAAALRILHERRLGEHVRHYFLINGVYCLDAGATDYEKSLHSLVMRYRARPKMLEIIYPTVRSSLAANAENSSHLSHFRPLDSLEHFVRYVQVLSGLYASYESLFSGDSLLNSGQIIGSDKDSLLSHRQSAIAQQVLVNAQVVQYANSGHYMPCNENDAGMHDLVAAIAAAASVDTTPPALASVSAHRD